MMPVRHQKQLMVSRQLLQLLLPPHGPGHPLLAQLPLHGPEQPLLGLERTLLPRRGPVHLLLPLLAPLPLRGPEQTLLPLRGLVPPLLFLVPLLLLLGLGHPLLAQLLLRPLLGLVLPPEVQTCPPLEEVQLLLLQEHQVSFPACHPPQEDTPLALGCQDSFRLHLGSFLECTPLLLGLLRLPTPTCPIQETCMVLEAQPIFLPTQGFLGERSHLCPLVHGAHTPAHPQDHMEAPLLLEECCLKHSECFYKVRAIISDRGSLSSHKEQMSCEFALILRCDGIPVPYDLQLHAGIMPRLLITIVGEPVPGGDRFQVDFMKGTDVVFHFNPRFSEQTIVRNSNLSGYWGPEERDGGFPFIQGQQFELKILVEDDVYKVALDGVHLLEYEHRAGGMEQVTLLRVYGDVTLYSIAPSII
ncbi:galectin-3 isoform X1 [Silurus meridionalis]|nr:galectin-3 isoform X1 [Silurus meridionalis]